MPAPSLVIWVPMLALAFRIWLSMWRVDRVHFVINRYGVVKGRVNLGASHVATLGLAIGKQSL